MTRFVTLTIRLGLLIGFLSGMAVLALLASIPLAKMESTQHLPAIDNTQPLAIDNVNVITMVGNKVLRSRQIVIENGRIKDIRPAGSPVDANVAVVDANDAWILPGLFDMHAHVYDRSYQVLSLTYGVTTVRNMAGFPFHLRWAEELRNGEWLGSNILNASPILNSVENADPLGQVAVSGPEHARQLVAQYKDEGWDYIKVYEDLPADTFRAILEEAKAQGLPVVGHIPYSVVDDAYELAAEMRTLEHAEEIYDGPLDYSFDRKELENTAQRLAELGATVTPTLMIFDQLTQISSRKEAYLDELPMEYINPLVKIIMNHTDGKRWLSADDKIARHNAEQNEFHKQIVRGLQRHRVNMVLGSDSGAIYAIQGLSTHEEMNLMVEAGLSPWSVLRTATSNAAKAAGVDDTHGTIEIGKTADLLMVWENPLFDLSVLREPRAVVKNGQYLNRERILELRILSLKHSSLYNTLGRLLEFQFYR